MTEVESFSVYSSEDECGDGQTAAKMFEPDPRLIARLYCEIKKNKILSLDWKCAGQSSILEFFKCFNFFFWTSTIDKFESTSPSPFHLPTGRITLAEYEQVYKSENTEMETDQTEKDSKDSAGFNDFDFDEDPLDTNLTKQSPLIKKKPTQGSCGRFQIGNLWFSSLTF